MNEIKLVSVKDLSGFTFHIPYYQRGYRWKKAQVQQLLWDIDSFRPTEKHPFYFLQALVVTKQEQGEGKYRVIDGQQRLTTLKLILEGKGYKLEYDREADQPIDQSYKKQTIECLNEFFNGKTEEEKKAFCRKVEESCRFLFYEVSTGNELQTFRELNSGKIPARDSELVKYLLLKSGSDEDAAVTQARAEEWDAMEREMGDDEFFAFLTPRNTWREEDRMTILFRYAGFTVDQKSNELFPFLTIIQQEIDKSSRLAVWEQICAAYYRLSAWFRNQLLYHAFGWYVHRKDGVEPRKLEGNPWWEELGKAKEYSPDENNDDYQQGGNVPLYRYLLLYNVAFCWRRRPMRYDFIRHRQVGVWSLEHIFARNQRDLTPEELKKWLPSESNQWEEYEKCCQKNEGNRWLAKKLGEKYPDQDDNSWRNLAMLPQNANASFNNNLFEGKRELVVHQWADLGWQHYWIPPATEAVFLKSLPGLSVTTPYWSESDKEAYVKHMESSICAFVEAVDNIFGIKDTDCKNEKINPPLPQYTTLPNHLFALLNRYRVVIPGIQRHYVQGGDSPRAAEVRKNFIQELFNACTEGRGGQLHFIYGPVEAGGDCFIPVDGQQRLTTLWLLARFIAEYLPPEEKTAVLQRLSRFSYTGRIHAKRFCKALTAPQATWQPGTDPQETIPRQPWFWAEWQRDETVASMLRMLSTIYGEFCDASREITAEKVWTFLLEKVTFNLLADHFSDDIYLKLNARGLQLTQWENFKGKFAEHLKDTREMWNKKIEQLSNKYFARAQLPDNALQQLPDNAFFALAARLAVVPAKIANHECGEQIEKLAFFTNWKQEIPYVPFDQFTQILAAPDEFAENYLRLVDLILRFDNDAATEKWFSPYWQKTRQLWETVFMPQNQNELDLSLLIYFYCVQNQGTCPDDFYKALRCMWNILENVSRNNERPFDRLVKFRDSIIERRGRSLYGIAEADRPQEKEALQWQEERAKADIYAGVDTDISVELLQKAEYNMHGRVRLGILKLPEGNVDFDRKKWLEKLNNLFSGWNQESEERREKTRQAIVLNLVASYPEPLQDAIRLSTDDGNLLALLTTQDDWSIQNYLPDAQEPLPQFPKSAPSLDLQKPYLRDWRQSILSLAGEGNKMIWGRTLKQHNTGIYYLYSGAQIRGALPVGDWRIELRPKGKLGDWYSKLCGKENPDFTINDGDTHNEKCSEEKIIYFGPDGITIRKKDVWGQYGGHEQLCKVGERLEVLKI